MMNYQDNRSIDEEKDKKKKTHSFSLIIFMHLFLM